MEVCVHTDSNECFKFELKGLCAYWLLEANHICASLSLNLAPCNDVQEGSASCRQCGRSFFFFFFFFRGGGG